MPSLELIREHDQDDNDPGLDIIIVHGIGRYKTQSWSTDAEEDDKEWMWLSDIFPDGTEGTRWLMFKHDDAMGDGVDMLTPQGLNRLAKCLLQDIEKQEDSERPLVFVAHGFGGIIVKEALVMAERNADFITISRRMSQLVFFGVPHRPSSSNTWEDMLLGMLFASRLPFSGAGNMATKLHQLSRHLDKSASDFVALSTRRCIINIYQNQDDEGSLGPTIDGYSATTGLVYETNIAVVSSHGGLSKVSQDGAVFPAIASSLRAEVLPDYRLCMSRLFELSPPFKVPDDQIDLYIREPNAQVLAAFDHWIDRPEPSIMATTGVKGIGKSLVARALFRRANNMNMSRLATYFSFAETDVSRASAVPFLASTAFQILKRDPKRFSRIKGLCAAIEDSGAWTEAGLSTLFQSLLDTETSSSTLVLVIDGIHRCDSSFERLIKLLRMLVETKDPLTTVKVAMFYQQRQDIRELLFSEHKQGLVLSGPELTTDTPVPMADSLAATAIRDRPYLAEMKEELEASLLACRYTTEMLLAIQRIDRVNAVGNFSTAELLKSVLGMEPPTITDAVSSVFSELSEWGRVALGWIAHSKRHLRLDELTTAVAITDKSAQFKASLNSDSLPLNPASAIKSAFGPLVRVEDGFIMFCNDVVRHEFDEQIKQDVPQRKIESARAKGALVSDLVSIPSEERITSVLVSYLCWHDFTDPINTELGRDGKFVRPSGRLFDLMEYAVQFLPHHHRASQSTHNQKLLRQSRQLALTWPRLNSMLNSTASPSDLCVSDPLLLAAQLGLTDIVKALGRKIDIPLRQVVLRLASWNGSLDTVRVVVEGAAKEDVLDCSTALDCASARGHYQVVYDLLQYLKSKTGQALSPSVQGGLVCRAAELGYENQVELFLANGAQSNAAADEITPLQHAARNGHAALVNKLLTQYNADVESGLGRGEDRPIILAAEKGYRQVIRHLLGAGAEVTCLTRDGSKLTPLHLAAKHGYTEVARLLLDAEKQTAGRQSAINQQCSQRRSPLITACKGGHTEVAMLLLAANADVTMVDTEEHTALFYALRSNNKDLALEILKHATSLGSFLDAGDVFLLAAEVGHDELISRYAESRDPVDNTPLVEYTNLHDNTALHFACLNGHSKVVDLLLQSGAPVHAINDEGQTPLVRAADAGKPEIVATLLARGATLVTLGDGQTIVTRLASSSSEDSIPRVEVATMLLKAGVDVNAADWSRRSALIWAVSKGKLEMTRALLRDPNVDPNATASFRWNALHYAGSSSHKNARRIAELLLKAGTDPMALDVDGWLPLHLAAQNSNIALMELLLEHNPESLEVKAYDGRTALHFSIKHHKAQATKWLLDYGADVNAIDYEKKTALAMVAGGRGNSEHFMTLLGWKDCDVFLAQGNGRTALHQAALAGLLTMGRKLLEANAEILSCRDENNLSALHLAIKDGKTEFAEMLLNEFYSANPAELSTHEQTGISDTTDTATRKSTSFQDLSAVETKESLTPLISAIKASQWNVMRKLLRLGAGWEHRDKRGRTALLHGVWNFEEDQNLSVVRDLLDTSVPSPVNVNEGGGIYPTALHEAACLTCSDQMSLIEELVDRQGAQVNQEGGQYGTALGAAAATGHLEVALYLLKSGKQGATTSSWSPANPDLPGGKYANALNAALYSWTFDLVKPLLDAGNRHVQVSATDTEGRSALHLAARRGNWEKVQQLRPESAGPDAFLADRQGRTLLHFAAMSGNHNTFLLLLADEEMNWESLDVKDSDGWTPLHWACRQDANARIVESLIQYGADVIVPAGDDGWTAENIAISHGASAAADLITKSLAHISRPRREASESPGTDQTGEKEGPRRKQWKIGQLHRGIYCDSCFLFPIVGIRWICNDCVDFDLCFKCYRHVTRTHDPTHDPTHKFTRLPCGDSSYWKPELESDTTDDSSGSE